MTESKASFGEDVRAAAAPDRQRRGLFSFLGRIKSAEPRPPEKTAPPDPESLFGALAHIGLSGGAAPAGGEALLDVLTHNARETSGRLEILKKDARRIGHALNARREADALEMTQRTRIFIAVVWGAAAFWVLWPHIVARLSGAPLPLFALPIDDALVLGQIFGVLFGLGAVAGYTPYLIGMLNGRFSMRGIVDRSGEYGRRLAAMLKFLDNRLLDHRNALTRPESTDAAVAAEVARAHVTAQSAIQVYEELGFVVDDQPDGHSSGDEAARRYAHYLEGAAVHAEDALYGRYLAGLTGGLIAGLVFGAFFGIVWALLQFGIALGKTLGDAVEPLGGLDRYPDALALIVFGALTYFFLAGPIGAILDEIAGRRPRRARLDTSLRVIRSALTADQAPRARDIAQRVEDLSEIFRTRLARGAGGPASAHQGEDLAWRKQPEAPRFVEQSFAAAPPAFVAGSPPAADCDFFSGRLRPDAAPKQSLGRAEKRPWLKD